MLGRVVMTSEEAEQYYQETADLVEKKALDDGKSAEEARAIRNTWMLKWPFATMIDYFDIKIVDSIQTSVV